MSSKVVTGIQAAEAESFDWGGQTGVPPLRPATAKQAPQAEADEKAAEFEARLAEMEKKIAAARQEGWREGEAAGVKRATASLEPVLERLARTIEEIASLRTRFRREAEADLVRLALAMARRILNREVHSDPEALLGLVKAALGKIDARQTQRLRMHPQDLAAIESHLKRLGFPEGLEVLADRTLERGAAVFETSLGTLDASIETQLEEIERGLTDRLARAQ